MCLEECKPVLREIFRHPCFAPNIYNLFRTIALRNEDQTLRTRTLEYYYLLDSCAAEFEREKCHGNERSDNLPESELSGAQGLSSILAVMISSLILCFC